MTYKNKKDTYCALCNICGNTSFYDKHTLKTSTMNINGVKTIICTNCEDEIFIQIAKQRGFKLHY